ncbi:MAG: hypothetical protein ABWK53_07810 [Anaerolineales bacterium]
MPKSLLSDIIRVRTSHLRAVRLEDDLQSNNLLGGYTLTAQALAALERIADGLTNHARAWTLTGPYGSGKSFFALFLAHLLDRCRPGHTLAWKLVIQADPSLTERLSQVLGERGSLQTIAVTGSRTPLQECLARGFQQVLESSGFPAEWQEKLEIARRQDSRAFVRWVEMFLEAASRPGSGANGLLIVFDEMGKALEHAASHPQESDVYLLQELAELAAHSNKHPLVFIGILHQAFDGYAALLDRATQREWAKVQGRFEDIPFQEPAVQQMRLLANAFVESDFDFPVHVPTATLQEWCPATLSDEEFEALCRRVYPLHPSAFVSLPHIFRRLAQNERSIFAYLSSQEPFGFQEFLATHRRGELLHLSDIFDYLAANYQSRIYASGRARPLTETLERLENTPSLKKIEQDLLKTIGLLNWLGEISPLQAHEKMIVSALTPAYGETDLRTALTSLQRRSLIVFRRFNETYAVWQGSDVDIEERLQAARAALGTTLSVAEILQGYLPSRPLLARRYSYQTGSLRFFDVRYVDSQNRDMIPSAPSTNASGLVLLCLPATLEEVEQFERWARSEHLASQRNLVIGVSGRAIRLKELAQELRGLHWVRENTPELRDDPVARREWRTRLAAIEQTIRTELDEAFNLHQISALHGCQWFHSGRDVSPKVRRGLSALLSEICDALYPDSPRLWNELLNRRELTSQGAAARRTLIEGILTRAEQPLLGIQKFPPERSMYEALLRRGRLHRQKGEAWFIAPPSKDNPLRLRPAWEVITDFVFSGLPEPRPVTDLYTRLFAPPYGVTAGLAPVLLALFYKVHENEITLYKEGTLLAEPGVADWEVLLRRPELFAVAGCRVTGLRAAVLERMARGLQVPSYVMPVVRSLIGRLKALPEHAWRTRKLPETAIHLRRAVEIARSPERFLFVEVPEALGLLPFEDGEFDSHQFEAFFERLNQALDALANATPRLLIWARDVWLTACGLPASESGWEEFRQQSIELARRVTNPTLLPLLKRAVEAADSRAALESVLAFIASRPPRTWTDTDAERFEAQAAYLGDLWRAERAEGDLRAALSPEMRARALALAERLEDSLRQSGEPPEALRAALQLLLERLKG